MPHAKTDRRRLLLQFQKELETALRTRPVSVGFEERDGTWKGDEHETGETPLALRAIGGEWDPLGQRYVAPAAAPVLALPLQRQQTPAVASDAQFVAIFGGQRSGKSVAGRYRALRTLIEKPGSIVFYLLPSFGKTEFTVEELIRRLNEKGWIEAGNKQEHWWRLINGSRVQAFSQQYEEAFLGGECDHALIEEFREMPDRVFASLFSRIISRNGQMTIVTSPEAGHMIEEIDKGEWAGRIDFDVHHLSVARNYTLFDEPQKKILDMAKAIYDERKYQRDVLGLNVAEYGHDFYNWSAEQHAIEDWKTTGTPCTELLWRSRDLWLDRDHRSGHAVIRPDPTLRQCRLVGLDFGASIMSAVECILTTRADISAARAQFTGRDPAEELSYENTNLVVVKEHERHDTSVIDFVEHVLIPAGLTKDRAALFCDPTGLCRDHVVGQSPVDMLTKRYGYKVYSKRGGTLRMPGIEAIRIRLHMQRLFVDKRGAPGLIIDMGKVRTIGVPQKTVSRDPHGHKPDALRYVVDNLFPVRDLFKHDRALEAARAAVRGAA